MLSEHDIYNIFVYHYDRIIEENKTHCDRTWNDECTNCGRRDGYDHIEKLKKQGTQYYFEYKANDLGTCEDCIFDYKIMANK